MGTRRLRIVDAEHGVQPQISFNERLAVAFNGEIYNYLELRKELADLGVEFRTESDTEVLANALQVWGYRALERLVGMYAFVAVDLANGEFLAARDPFGVKPLYVIQSGSSFLFCSEMRPLLKNVPAGDVMLLPPGYALSRKNCARFKSPVYPRADVPVHHDPHTLDRILSELSGGPAFRVLLIHHSLSSDSRHKRLTDSDALLALLRRHGADLVLHGHDHVHSTMWFDGPHGRFPAIGVPSASSVAHGRIPAAAYNLFRIERDGERWRCEQVVRGFGEGDEIQELRRARLY
jgi:hypothetical protein